MKTSRHIILSARSRYPEIKDRGSEIVGLYDFNYSVTPSSLHIKTLSRILTIGADFVFTTEQSRKFWRSHSLVCEIHFS